MALTTSVHFTTKQFDGRDYRDEELKFVKRWSCNSRCSRREAGTKECARLIHCKFTWMCEIPETLPKLVSQESMHSALRWSHSHIDNKKEAALVHGSFVKVDLRQCGPNNMKAGNNRVPSGTERSLTSHQFPKPLEPTQKKKNALKLNFCRSHTNLRTTVRFRIPKVLLGYGHVPLRLRKAPSILEWCRYYERSVKIWLETMFLTDHIQLTSLNWTNDRRINGQMNNFQCEEKRLPAGDEPNTAQCLSVKIFYFTSTEVNKYICLGCCTAYVSISES